MVGVIVPQSEIIRRSKLPYSLPKKLREILNGFRWAMHEKKQSVVLIVDGRSGLGKTTISGQIGLYLTPNFSLDNIHFTPEEFLEALTRTKKGDTLVFDEAMLLSSRATLSKINRMIVIAMSMIRSKNLCIIFNVNSIFDLDRNLALSRADLLLHCYGDSLTDKGKFLTFFKGGDGRDRIKELYIHGKKYYSYGTPKSNFNAMFGSYFVVDEDEYETKKQIGVNNFLKGTKIEATNRYIKQRNILLKIIKDFKDIPLRELEEFLNIHGLKITYSGLSRVFSTINSENEQKDRY